MFKSTCKVCNNIISTKHKLKWHETVKITIISHDVTLIPGVHNENGADETEDNIDITIEEERDKIISKCGRKLTIRTCCGLLPITTFFEVVHHVQNA